MFRVLAKRVTTCDGASRRNFLPAGPLAALGPSPDVQGGARAATCRPAPRAEETHAKAGSA